MQRTAFILLLLIVLAAQAHAAPAGRWSTLFNGRDLHGWFTGPDNAWKVENGLLILQREFDGREHNADYLWTKDTYGDFVLEVEVKMPERANSGIFLRTSDIKDPVYTGIEIQVANSFGSTNLSRTGTAGAVYDCLAPTRNVVKPPGEWNHYQITCRGSRLEVALNGVQVISMDLDQWTESQINPDGSKNKFPVPLKNFARRGHVGLQDHGRPIWFRNIRIKPL